MEKGLVSIIIPCYNGERYVAHCLDSILAQTYKKLEVIVVDDGSTDGSAAAIKSYEAPLSVQGMTLNYVYQNNKGSAGAINTGLKHVNGEFLHLLDIDDLLLPTAVEEKLSLFDEDISLVRSNGYYVFGDEPKEPDKLFTDKDLSEQNDSLFDRLMFGSTYNWAGSYMVRTSALFDFYKDREIYLSKYGQNLQIMLPATYKHKSAYTNTPLMKYVKHAKSLSSQDGNIEKTIDNNKGYEDIRLHLLDRIVKDEGEKQYYRKTLTEIYSRTFLELYYEANNKKEALNAYKKLKSVCKPSKNDKFLYYKLKHPHILNFYNRIIKKQKA